MEFQPWVVLHVGRPPRIVSVGVFEGSVEVPQNLLRNVRGPGHVKVGGHQVEVACSFRNPPKGEPNVLSRAQCLALLNNVTPGNADVRQDIGHVRGLRSAYSSCIAPRNDDLRDLARSEEVLGGLGPVNENLGRFSIWLQGLAENQGDALLCALGDERLPRWQLVLKIPRNEPSDFGCVAGISGCVRMIGAQNCRRRNQQQSISCNCSLLLRSEAGEVVAGS
mmetsp:Transcript_20254/g.44224  ORF Transcript_20254/g.44224 Transcript_20254/m.44224 type:complete len:222 (+) Transcript_20254:486-1151(+)